VSDIEELPEAVGEIFNRSNGQTSHLLESGPVSPGGLAKRSFPRATPISARKVFVARINVFLLYWREPGFWDEIFPHRESPSALFQRMRSDERMQVTWGRLAALSDADFWDFMDKVIIARSTAGWYRGFSGAIEERLREIRQAGQAVGVLLRLCEQGINIFDWDEEASKHISLATGAVPGLPDHLKTAQAILGEQEQKLNKKLQKTRQQLSRKSAGGRVEFIRAVAGITKRHLGKPHYEIVAALAKCLIPATTTA
jgi:hypothetical protein